MIDLRSTLGRWHWRNWPVLVKLVAVLLVPTLVAIVVGVLQIVHQASAAPGYSRISQIAGVQQKLSGLIGALQRERDLAAEFVAAGRPGERPQLDEQFRLVATRSVEVQGAADQVENLGSTGHHFVLDQLGALRPLRQSVLTGTGPVELVVTEYGAAITPLIALDAALVRQLDAVAVADDAAAVHALLVSREQISNQHAIVRAALPANRIAATQIDDVRAAAVRLGAEQEAFTAALQPAERDGYVTRAIGDAELSRQRLLKLVLNRGGENRPLDISPDDWSARSASALDDLVVVENELRQRIDRTALGLRDAARSAAAWNTFLLSFALGLGVLIGVMIARSMLRPLGVLKRTALDVAGRRLPAAMVQVREGAVPDQRIEPVAVSSGEEIGQVARAFDEVHRQAMRLAAEQAELRAHLNDIFVNLSRRSQSLIERQLQLIDRLESTEQDPEQLSNLFQLDHLATRMRRNSDNLLVLAGTEATKRANRPVRLIDVLRAAVSEVEQYQRLVLQQPPGMLMLGRAAGDLVHLLAELLDNATQFASPDTQVIVSTQLVADGSVVIEVADRGVGMTESELAEANERLASRPVVDASVSRRMGLFVIGRLAIRHGIRVRLRCGDHGAGVCASVGVPAQLVRSMSEPGDTPAVPALSRGGDGDGRALVEGGFPPPGVPLANGKPLGNGGSLTNGHGSLSTGAGGRSEAPLPRRTGRSGPTGLPLDPPVQPTPAGPSPAPVGLPLASAAPPPALAAPPSAPPGVPSAPPGPPVSHPPVTPGAEPGLDLFQPVPPDGVTASPEPSSGVTLQDSTPIFDDVASAWFREHQAVPVGWAMVRPPTTSPDRPAGPASPTRAFDDGWHAAQALAAPVSVEVTAAGLPRRKPRALLVPGVAGAAVSAQSASSPVRSAEVVRGRLASYQQGIRKGRQTCYHPDQDAHGSSQYQNAAEETK